MRENGSDEPTVVRRVEEADAAIGDVVGLTALAIAAIGFVRVPEYGWWFAVASSLPLVVIIARRLGADRYAGAPAGAAAMVGVTAVAAAWSTSIGGGMSNPGYYWGGIVAMLGMTLFPEQRLMFSLGALITTAVTLGDLLLGRDVSAYDFVCALILSVAIPAAVARIVALEHLHRERSVIDPLTGCLNRRALDTRIVEVEEQAGQIPMQVAVISVDIDHFKRVNDHHGHDAGDRVLAEVAYHLRKGVESFDAVFRLGGEEFVVLLVGADLDEASVLAERLRASVEVRSVDGISVTASFGVAAQSSPILMSELLRDADQRLYAAKRGGRNRVVGSEPSIR